MRVYFTVNDRDEPMVYRENDTNLLRYVMPSVPNVATLLDLALNRVAPGTGLRVTIYYHRDVFDFAVLMLKIAQNKGAYDIRMVPCD